MSQNEFPVTVAVERNGRVEYVRVGTAVKEGEGFVLRLGELQIGAVADTSPVARRSAPPAAAGGLVFPNYGRRKGEAVAGAEISDLEYYAAGCRRTLDDPGKARWHEKERGLLSALEAEIARQQGGAPPARESRGGDSNDEMVPSFGGDDDIPF